MNWTHGKTARIGVNDYHHAESPDEFWGKAFAEEVWIFAQEDGTFHLSAEDDGSKGSVTRKTLGGAKRTAERMLREQWWPKDFRWNPDWLSYWGCD